jgi:hypothetical protein
MTHELDYYAAALHDLSAGMGDLTPADIQALSSFQKTQCGIGGQKSTLAAQNGGVKCGGR